jgi:hypothetical protein
MISLSGGSRIRVLDEQKTFANTFGIDRKMNLQSTGND